MGARRRTARDRRHLGQPSHGECQSQAALDRERRRTAQGQTPQKMKRAAFLFLVLTALPALASDNAPQWGGTCKADDLSSECKTTTSQSAPEGIANADRLLRVREVCKTDIPLLCEGAK